MITPTDAQLTAYRNLCLDTIRQDNQPWSTAYERGLLAVLTEFQKDHPPAPPVTWRPVENLPYTGSDPVAFLTPEGYVLDVKQTEGWSAPTHFLTKADLRRLPPAGAPKTSGMTFSEALEAMKAGRKVRSAHWSSNGFVYCRKGTFLGDDGLLWRPYPSHLLKNDWEIYEEPKPKTEREIAEEEFEAEWGRTNGFSKSGDLDGWKGVAWQAYLAAKGFTE